MSDWLTTIQVNVERALAALPPEFKDQMDAQAEHDRAEAAKADEKWHRQWPVHGAAL